MAAPSDTMLGKLASAEDALMTKLVGEGSKRASQPLGRFGDVTKQPATWFGIAGAMALAGPRGRQAAARGSVSYVAAVVAHLAVKAFVRRTRPPGASTHTSIGPLTSSFPSGHCASELAFSLGAAQEVPWLFVPLYAATLAGEWSLVRSRAHYPSDIFAGAAISVAVALVARRVWPPHRTEAGELPEAADQH
jgi:undecaprenyl-diphosphatase